MASAGSATSSAATPPAFEQAANEVTAPDAGFLAGAVAGNIAAVAEQTRTGSSSTRRTGGRIATPFLETLPGQGRVRAGSQVTGASLAESDVELTAADDQSEQGGA